MAELDSATQIGNTGQQDTSPVFLKPAHPLKAVLENSKAAGRTRGGDNDDDERPTKKARLAPPALTAAAAIAAARPPKLKPQVVPAQTPTEPQTSINPSFEILNVLNGSAQNAMSKPIEAPIASSEKQSVPVSIEPREAITSTTTTTGAAAVTAAAAPSNTEQPPVSEASGSLDSQALTSPVSLSSAGTHEALPGISGITNTTVGSPQPIEDTFRHGSGGPESGSTSPNEGPKSFSYPAPLLQPPLTDMIRRGHSLPHSNTRQGTRSPSSKKHQCPYCATEFTRHHNLKSHLLTHSQEKPYVCSTCSSRFRRLHDLKRHTKLHTGERPHICPRCKRKFARGDALARHNKGPGGCANRRASLGDYAGNDTFDGDESMDGVVYHEPEAMDEEEGNDRRPGIRRHAPSGDDTEDNEPYSRLPSTYPPIQGRPHGGITSSVFQPRSGYSPSGSGSSASIAPSGPSLPPGSYPYPSSSQSSGRPNAGAPIFAQNPMTESPKPLSPGQPQPRVPATIDSSLSSHRSPSLTHFPSQPPVPHGSHSRSGSVAGVNVPGVAPQLPPPHTLHPPPDSRFTLPSQIGPTHPPTQPSGPPTHMNSGPLSSHSNSHSSHGQSGHGSGDAHSMFTMDDRIWAYVKNLEQRMNAMAEDNKTLEQRFTSMQEEINTLRSRPGAAAQNPQPRAP